MIACILCEAVELLCHVDHIAQDYGTTKVKTSTLTSGVSEEVPKVESYILDVIQQASNNEVG